jgi:hypothetical protein
MIFSPKRHTSLEDTFRFLDLLRENNIHAVYNGYIPEIPKEQQKYMDEISGMIPKIKMSYFDSTYIKRLEYHHSNSPNIITVG